MLDPQELGQCLLGLLKRSNGTLDFPGKLLSECLISSLNCWPWALKEL